ncbi:hypothetical protein ID866_1447, partial [Astraeus odoratus]
CTYLVDVIAPPDPVHTLSSLLRTLRDKDPIFRDVVLWSDSTHMQSFFINTKLLEDKLVNLGEGIAFIHLDESLTVSTLVPIAVKDVLLGMYDAMTSRGLSFTFSEKLTPQILVPLAAVLIDYPVAYVPISPDETAFLQGEILDVYDVAFRKDALTHGSDRPSFIDTHEFTFLRFSCPRRLADSCPELSTAYLTQKLKNKFTPRLEEIGARVHVSHRIEKLDRVAL